MRGFHHRDTEAQRGPERGSTSRLGEGGACASVVRPPPHPPLCLCASVVKRRSRERGVALVLVLVLLPLVAIIMTQLSFETTIGDRLARNALANEQFKA